MDPVLKKCHRSCEEAVQHFDPAFCYMVFDNHVGGKETFALIYDILSHLAGGTVETELCRQAADGQYRLIARAASHDIDAIVAEFHERGLQDRLNYCVYMTQDA